MANQDMSSIIVERRKALRMTQRDLAEKLNVSDQTVSRWETGTSYPDASIIPALADVLQVDIAVLFSRTPKAEVLSKEDLTDYHTLTKFKILIGVAAALFVVSSVFGFSLQSVIGQSGPYTALLIITTIFAFAGVILGCFSLAWFRSFYRGKFYNELYRSVYYRYSILLSAAVMPLAYAIALRYYNDWRDAEAYLLFGVSAVTLLLFLFLVPWGKNGDMVIPWNGKSITLLVLGILFTVTGCLFIARGVAMAQFGAYLAFQILGFLFDGLLLALAKPGKN